MFSDTAEMAKSIYTGLYVAAVCDILDSLGYRNQAMHHRLRPLLPDRAKCGFVGRARRCAASRGLELFCVGRGGAAAVR